MQVYPNPASNQITNTVRRIIHKSCYNFGKYRWQNFITAHCVAKYFANPI